MHVEKHLDKTDEQLVLRMMSEWKLACSRLLAKPQLDASSLREGENDIEFDNCVGVGFNRFYEKITSNVLRVIVENGEILTSYPVLEGRSQDRFDFSAFDTSLFGDAFNPGLWQVFTSAVAQGKQVRYVWWQKQQKVKIYDSDGLTVVDENLHETFQSKYPTSRVLKTPMQIALESAGLG
jgi:hypothetical protein